ncbi:patatin-like phospholipase family protein [Chondromyces apiculatus]|uniref:Alpha-beta superfamily hydrolase n=1 Tax=Chondromyces apiculatus DSM 436 TaxID=1192034 RepID=A0A017T1T1_9BACT|nr:patatin family protein [Chondromyces apiculatus]EYF02496.1 alpha-beta superfamily hydrolase [Chondromyces apiculatus DSM 436]
MTQPSPPPPSSPHTATTPALRTATLFVEGGGLRGAFSAGALAELSRPGGPRFDDVVAVSSGAPTAAYMVAGQIDDGLRIWEDYTHGTQLISPLNWLRASPLMDIERLVGVFARVVPLDAGRLRDAHAALWIVVTNCHTGRAEYVRATPENTLGLLQATMAIPIAYGRVVPVGGIPYIDGGVADAIPAHHALSLKRDLTVAVLTRPRGYRRTNQPALTYAMGRTYPSHPEIGRTLSTRWKASNNALELIEDLERRGEMAVIRPPGPLPAGRLSTRREDILATIEAGREAARTWLRTLVRR